MKNRKKHIGINRAVSHFKWKLENKWNATESDIEAYNAIIDYVEHQKSTNLTNNESLAKLWIERLILLSRTNMYNGKEAIKAIDDTLDKSVYDWCKILQEEIPMMRFNSIGRHKYPLSDVDIYNLTKIRERNKKIIEEFETELTVALMHKAKEGDIIKFVEDNINRIIEKQ